MTDLSLAIFSFCSSVLVQKIFSLRIKPQSFHMREWHSSSLASLQGQLICGNKVHNLFDYEQSAQPFLSAKIVYPAEVQSFVSDSEEEVEEMKKAQGGDLKPPPEKNTRTKKKSLAGEGDRLSIIELISLTVMLNIFSFRNAHALCSA